MRKLFCLFGLFAISLSASASSEWLYYKHYPWVYDNVSKDWLYLRGSSDGEIYAYRTSTNAWEVFRVQKTWEQKYEEWIQNPEPYGGLSVLQQIKEAKETRATELDLLGNNITDLSPLAGLTNLTHLWLENNKITDLTPLTGLTNLTEIYLNDNPITASQKAMLEEALPNTSISWPNVIIVDSVNLKVWMQKYEGWILNPEPFGGMEVLHQIKYAKETGATEFYLSDNNITDFSPLAELTNLTNLIFVRNNITDLSPLAGLTNLKELDLLGNNITDLTPLTGLKNLTSLWLEANNISDLTPLTGLTNLGELWLSGNNISDITPLAGLTNLGVLYLLDNPITASQKAILEEALPNTTIYWPDVIIDDILDTTPPEFIILSQFGDWPSYNSGLEAAEFPSFSYSAIDNVDGDLTEHVEVTTRLVSGFVDGAEWGWAEVIFSVTDAASNTTTHTESGPSEPIGFLVVP